jgi:release factor glutamine methyltransferase
LTISQALHSATQQLEQAGVNSPKTDAEWLLVYALGSSQTVPSRAVLLESNRQLTAAQQERYHAWLARRVGREPLQWILGNTEFYGLELQTQRGVLIPRPETERLVELALERLPTTGRVVDVGCGTGAIALAIKAQRPNLELWATDLNPKAVALSRENAQRLGLEIHVQQTSLLAGLAGKFAAIVSNPPYLPNSDHLEPEVQLEPKEALFSGQDGLDLARELLRVAPNFLLPHGWLMLELDPRNAPVLQHEMQGWEVQLESDWSGRARFLLAKHQSQTENQVMAMQ